MKAHSKNSTPPKVGRPQAQIDLQQIRALAAADLTVGEIATAIGIARSTLYEHFRTNPAIQEAYDEGVEIGTRSLKQVAMRRALEGDATLLRFLIQKRDPRYGTQLNVKHSGGVLHGVVALSESEVDAQLAELEPAVVEFLAQQKQPALLAGTVIEAAQEAASDGNHDSRSSRDLHADGAADRREEAVQSTVEVDAVDTAADKRRLRKSSASTKRRSRKRKSTRKAQRQAKRRA